VAVDRIYADRRVRRGANQMTKNQATIERFLDKVVKTEECWLWVAAVGSNGYGQFRYQGKTVEAHRVSWELHIGPIPVGLVIDHDNPSYGCGNILCVNPNHLEPVTKKVNAERRRHGAQRNNKSSGIRNVYWDHTLWRVMVKHHGKMISGGWFKSLADAERAASELRERLWLR
jgi:HNH endonuclease